MLSWSPAGHAVEPGAVASPRFAQRAHGIILGPLSGRRQALKA
jgi:hypothetical protein